MKHIASIEIHWSGITAEGTKTSGILHCKNKKTAEIQLVSDGITILNIKKKKTWKKQKTLSEKNKLLFTQQLALLLQSGAALVDALQCIITTSPTKSITHTATLLKEKITGGGTFSTALAQFPDTFNEHYCQLIAAGERTDHLEKVLQQLIEHYQQAQYIKQRIKNALTYPIIVLVVALFVTIGLMIFVIPQFHAIYSGFNAALPIFTEILISFSQWLMKNSLTLLITFLFLAVCITYVWRSNIAVRLQIHRLLLCVPGLRTLIILQQIASWTQTLSLTLSANLPLLLALQLSNNTLTNPYLKETMRVIPNAIQQGSSLSIALAQCHHFPKQYQHLLAIGENADALEIAAQKLALSAQAHCTNIFDRLSKLLEPVIMLGVASVLAGLIIAMYLPIFQMGSVIR